jgi:hypothetical protein
MHSSPAPITEPEPEQTFAVVFAVPVSLYVCASEQDLARAGARRLIRDDQANLRDAIWRLAPTPGYLCGARDQAPTVTDTARTADV